MISQGANKNDPAAPVEVVLDTDIGDDIDDTWALAMLLGLCDRVNLRLIVTGTGDTAERARLTAKILERAGRSDIPVGIGVRTGGEPHNQAAWLGAWSTSEFSGQIIPDGVGALIDAVNARPGITLLAIGPQTNLAEALRRDPSIAAKARVVAMAGSVYQGYGGSPERAAEYNIAADVPAARAALAAAWEKTWTPLDTCGSAVLSGARYRQVADSPHPLARIVIENYDAWAHRAGHPVDSSSVLFDTVAAYMTFDESLLRMETVNISIDDAGRTLPDANGHAVRCALEWADREAFERLLVGALTGALEHPHE